MGNQTLNLLNIVRNTNNMEFNKNLKGKNLVDEFNDGEDDDQPDIRSEKIIDIVRGSIGEDGEDSKRGLRISLAILYVLGKHEEPKSLSFIDRNSDYLSKSTVSKRNYLENLEDDGLINVIQNEDSRRNELIISLTTLGEEIYLATKDLFESLDKVNELERKIISFENRYGRLPSKNEIKNMVGPNVSKKDIFNTSINWEEPNIEEYNTQGIAERIAIGYVVCQTSAVRLLGGMERNKVDINPLVMGFSKTEGNDAKNYEDYASKNKQFLENLNLYYNGYGTFRLEFDDFTEYVLNEEGIVFEIAQPEDVEEELKEIAEESNF